MGFDPPGHLLAKYDDETAWVLCLRAYVDAGPTDEPQR
eukprot:SAG31_NODE_35207_length_325_cov_0.902655_2_plen_37_part_01